LQDARREVSPETEARMLTIIWPSPSMIATVSWPTMPAGRTAQHQDRGHFRAPVEARRQAALLSLIPRVWAMLERDLAHPALAPVAAWFDANIPADLRDAGGGSLGA
jgi:aminoglycoside/choline kinase family phosphotransferase